MAATVPQEKRDPAVAERFGLNLRRIRAPVVAALPPALGAQESSGGSR